MKIEIHNQSTLARSDRYRHWGYLLLFGVLLALASLPVAWVEAAELGQTVPGTIPPGGTLPAPLTPTPGLGLVRVLHLAPFDADLADTAIDICTQAGDPVAGFTDLVYLEQSGYSTLPPGTYDWAVGTPGCATVLLDLPAFTLGGGSVLTLLIVGGGDQPLTSVLVVDREAVTYSYLPLIHH